MAMGLDMYAFAVTHEDCAEIEASRFVVEFSALPRFGVSLPESKEKIAYWRKFNALHGWMQALYRKLGGDEEFNCIALELTRNDLDDLSLDIKENKLTPLGGYFFGDLSIDLGDVNDTLKFIDVAKSKIPTHRIYYYSWW